MKNVRSRRQSGFTMLEVLISMVIIAFGLLGVAGLQVFALQSNQSAAYRSTAAMLANDIADRVRTNIGGSIDGLYNQPSASGYTTAVSNCTAVAGCTTTQLANNDLFEWQQRVAVSLPGGVGRVCLDTTPHDGTGGATAECDGDGGVMNRTNYVVKIWWTDDRTRGASTIANCAAGTCRFSTTFNQ